MKYPKEQFEILVNSLKTLSKYIDISEPNATQLHFLVWQQFENGQKHNWLVLNNNKVERNYTLVDNKIKGYKTDNGAKKVIDMNFNFELYPNNTNDNHIETAVKKALKLINE